MWITRKQINKLIQHTKSNGKHMKKHRDRNWKRGKWAKLGETSDEKVARDEEITERQTALEGMTTGNKTQLLSKQGEDESCW